MKATVASAAVCEPEIVRRNTATIGNVRLRNWFQRLVSVIARAMSRVAKPDRRNIPYDPAAPTAMPPGTTIDSAVDACVTSMARKNERPGSTTCQGGANVARLNAVAASRATPHCHDNCLTTIQTSR